MSVLQQSLDSLTTLARREAFILASYSGGKDSLAVIDLCVKTFGACRVKAFFWYLVPDLDVDKRQLDFARERWGIDPVCIPHWDGCVNAMRNGLYCDVKGWKLDDLPKLDLKMAYAHAMSLTDAPVCATGMKDADGLPRRLFFANIRDGGNPFWKRLVHPIRAWNKKDVLDYLRTNNIPIPESVPGFVTSGVSLAYESLIWMHDSHPDDFKKILKWFPYAEAAIKRRDWFGLAV